MKAVKILALALAGLIAASSIVWMIVFRPLTPIQLFVLIASSEEVGWAEITLVKKATKREAASTLVRTSGIDHELMLPNGATPYGTGHPDSNAFMICSDALEPYFDRLPSLGYTFVEQMGSMYFYRNDALGVGLQITRRQFSHAFYIVGFQLLTQ